MRTRLVVAVLPVALLGMAALPSSAAPKEVKGTFDATGVPDPSADGFETCQGLLPTARFEVPLEITEPGKLKVEITGFQGDWDLTVEDANGAVMGSSGGFIEATTETLQVKFKKAAEITIVACNFLGGPTAAGSYVFTPAK